MEPVRQQKVLLICGDSSRTAPMRGILLEAGYAVCETGRGGNAISMLTQARPDAVVMDWNLPDCSALAVTRTIRADRRFARTPVMLTGLAIGAENIVTALEMGADVCMDGKIAPREMVARLRALLRRAALVEHARPL